MSRVQIPYKVRNRPPLTDKQKEQLNHLAKMNDSDIDYKDCPQCEGDGGLYYFKYLRMPKTDIHTKIDNDNLEWLKMAGRGYQARLNNVIRWARLNNCPIAQL